MWTSIAIVAGLALAPAQEGGLRLANDRPTYGVMGPTRPESKILPGDFFCVTFDIQNLKTDDQGKVQYRMGMEMTNAEGKVQFKRDAQDLTAINSLGGNGLPAFTILEVGTDTPPGTYEIKVTVEDRLAKATQTLTHKFEVLPKKFGVIWLHATYNFQNNPPAPAVCASGQELLVNFGVLGFQRGGARKQPKISVSMDVLDENGEPVHKKAFQGEFDKDLAENVEIVPMQFYLSLNRPGKFTLRLRATDGVSKKTAEASMPLTVVDSK